MMSTERGNVQHTTNAMLLGLAYNEHLHSISGFHWVRFLLKELEMFVNHRFDVLKEGWTM